MTKQDFLKLKSEIAEDEKNLANMESLRRELIETWNKAIREARQDIERRRNEIRSGSLQPELAEVLKDHDRPKHSRIKAAE